MEISVGDNVEFFFNEYKKAVIEDVLPRKNQLIRPNVANVDVAAIVVASVPQPDFVLVDKIILNCYIQDIKPVIIVNKSDINCEEFFDQIYKEYGDNIFRINKFNRIAINIDQTYLDDKELLKKLISLCEENNLPAGFVSLEIPEDMIPSNKEKIKALASQLEKYKIGFC